MTYIWYNLVILFSDLICFIDFHKTLVIERNINKTLWVKISKLVSNAGSVAKGLNNERRVVHHVASSILGSDTLLCLHRGAWGGISLAK